MSSASTWCALFVLLARSASTASHIHMHIISDDLCSKALKTKKHYNSFHPTLGFFLHVDDLLSRLTDDIVSSKPGLHAVSGTVLCLPLYWVAWWRGSEQCANASLPDDPLGR